MVSYLRDFVDLPLGVYPNLGYYTDRGWRFDPGDRRRRVRRAGARLARGGRADHRRLLRRRPEHIAAARERLAGTRPRAHRRPLEDALDGAREPATAAAVVDATPARRPLYPLDFPDLVVEPGVVAPGPPSFLRGGYLYRRGHRRAPRAASTSAAAPASSACSSRSTAPRTCTASTSTAAPSPTRSPTRSATASATASRAATRRPLPVDPRGALRGDRRQPDQKPVGPVRAQRQPPAGRTTGAACCSTSCSPSCPTRSRPRASPTSCSSRSCPQRRTAALLAAAGLDARGRRLRRLPAAARLRGQPRPRSSAWRSSATPTTCGRRQATLVAYLLEIHARAMTAERAARGDQRRRRGARPARGRRAGERDRRARRRRGGRRGRARPRAAQPGRRRPAGRRGRCTDARLRRAATRAALAYPLIEGELLRRRARRVRRRRRAAGAPGVLDGCAGTGYVAAPIVLGGHGVGFLHGDRAPARRRAPPRARRWRASPAGFAAIYERAVLLQRLRDQRRELRAHRDWAEARSVRAQRRRRSTSRTTARSATPRSTRPRRPTRPGDQLTAREVDVLQHMVARRVQRRHRARAVRLRGHGQVPRQEHPAQDAASNRAEATSRYLRA